MKETTVMATSMPEPIKRRVAAYINSARLLMEEQGELKPMAFIGVDGGEGLAMFPWGNVPNTNMAATMIRAVAKEGNATWVIVIMEAYVMRKLPDHNAVKVKLNQYGSVKDMPDREEALCVLVETTEQTWTGMAIQEKLEGNRATFGEVMFNATEQSEGRMVGLLPNRGTEH